MALISKSKKGRANGGYTRIFDNIELGALISRIHATSISAGSELEKIIPTHTTNLDEAEYISKLIAGKLDNGNYLITKKNIKKYFKNLIASEIEPDFLIICVSNTKIYIVELKDGDQFDTKKSAAEIQNLISFQQATANWLQKNEKTKFYTVEYKVCFFNAQKKEDVVVGMKNKMKISNAWTGKDFCKFLNISYETILEQRKQEAKKNLDFFINELMKIPEINKIISNYNNPE